MSAMKVKLIGGAYDGEFFESAELLSKGAFIEVHPFPVTGSYKPQPYIYKDEAFYWIDESQPAPRTKPCQACKGSGRLKDEGPMYVYT